MKDYPISKVKNVVLLGHGRAGKTSLSEAMLFCAGQIERMGTVQAGSTVSDYDAEEIKRLCSINMSLLPIEWLDTKINFIDTPGYFDFYGEHLQGVSAADGAVLVISGKSGISVGTEKAWEICQKNELPLCIFINKLDDEKADYHKVLTQLKEVFGKTIAPFLVPIKNGDKIDGFVNVVDMTARKFDGDKVIEIPVPSGMEDEINPVREMIIEAVAETDEALMEKYFAGEEFTPEEISSALRHGTKRRYIVPVLCGSAIKNQGTRLLLDAVSKYMPSPDFRGEVLANDKDGNPVEILPSEEGSLAAQCFKTISDPFIGKLSFIKVYRGSLKKDSSVYNANKEVMEKIGKIISICGKKQTEISEIKAGDIGVVPKLSFTRTGDTLCVQGDYIKFDEIDFPKPVMSMAILPSAKGDEEKIGAGLNKLVEEDSTLSVYINNETHQQIISGVGEQHLEVVSSKLKNKFGVTAILEAPKIPYRETIRKSVKVEGKHKKQSGGHGQYGHVWIEFEPCDSEDLVFAENVFGGAVPKNFFPAVEKGLRDAISSGVLAGFPVVGLKATLYDGSYHAVDSSEMAFKTAAQIAYKNGLPQASPVLLEPIGTLTVNVPETYMGDLMGDINKRRGRVLGSEPLSGGKVSITADVPMAEMVKFATDLRSMTQGRGSFTFEFSSYEQAPDHIAQKVISENKKD